jgi:molecular chaperone GrpE
MGILGQNGVKVIETNNQILDTDYHEAIAVIPHRLKNLKARFWIACRRDMY